MTFRPQVRSSKWLAIEVMLVLSASLQLLTGATLAAAELGFTVPNPFFDQTDTQQDQTHNSFYHIRATEVHSNGKGGLLDEYFSLGRAISLQVFLDESHQEYGLLTDGRSGKSYLVREPSKAKSFDELECELDSTHSHKHLFPWQFIYDVRRSNRGANADSSEDANQIVTPPIGLLPQLDSEIGNSTKRQRKRSKRNKRNFKATIFGLGAVWLNLIRADVRSTEIDNDSRYYNMNNWALKTEHVDLDMMFMKGILKRGQQLDQSLINKLQPAELHVNTKFRSNPDSPERRQLSRYVFKEFEQNLQIDGNQLLGFYLQQLDWCKKLTRTHRTFPNLMRAMATYGDRVYRLEYVTKRFNLLGVDLLNGEFNEHHHRYMFPQELVGEVFSLGHEIQTLIYDPNFIEHQEQAGQPRIDMFMSCYTERAEGRLARHAAQYYHQMVNGGDQQEHVCIRGEREPKPPFRLLSRAIKFHNERGIEYEGHLNGLGALLLNALEMRHSSNLLPLAIDVPLDYTQQEHRKASVNVWQVVDERQKVRALFYIERRNPEVEKRQLELAERDRNELARLVRVDIRSLASKVIDIGFENEEGNNNLAVTQQLIESDADLLLQYHVFEVAFELNEFEQSVYLEVPDNCQERKSPDDADDDEEEDDLSDTANNYDKNYDADDDDDDDDDDGDEDGHELNEQADNNDLEAEFQFESGLMEEDTPMPDFIQMLEGEVAYRFVSRIELAVEEGADERPKAIWLEEAMDLAREQLRLRIYLTRHDLELGLAHEEFLIMYQSEVVLKLWRVNRDDEQRRCMRLDDVNLKWLRLLSAHLVYYVVAQNSAHKPTDELNGEDLIAEENSLSSYGLGALWRRANQMGMHEYRGMKHERLVLNDGNGDQQYRQLVWVYQELDMTFELTFLLRDEPDSVHHKGHISTSLRLHSVLIRNEHAAASDGVGEQLDHFKPINIIVESFEMGGNNLHEEFSRIPAECNDILIEARRMTEIDHDVRPPDYKAVLGQGAQSYELEYTIFTNRNRPTSREEQLGLVPPRTPAEANLSNVPVRESFDLAAGLGRIVIYEHEPSRSLEIFVDNKRKLYLAYSRLINKCSRLTHLAPTYGTLLSTLVFDNEHFVPDKLHGLMGLWQALSKNPARLHVRQLLLQNGDPIEQQTYSQLISEKQNNSPNKRDALREEVKLHFEKRRPTRYGAPKIYKPDKTPIRLDDKLVLRMIEMKSVSRSVQQLAHEPFTRIAINRLQATLDDKWELPPACEQELNSANEPSDEDSEPESIDTNNHEQTEAHEKPTVITNPSAFPKLSDLLARSERFQMRSESSTYGGLDKLQLIDELYNVGSFRLRTRGLGVEAERNCDLLMFDNTHDQFDLSEPLRCPRLHDLEPDFVSRCLSPSLYDVWLGHKHRSLTPSDTDFEHIKNLAGLHYGPLSLWRLAEQISLRRPKQLKLIKTIELSKSSTSETIGQFRQRLEHQMNREIWQVDATDGDSTKSWSFLLHFTKNFSLSDPKDVWYLLEQVSVTDVHEESGEKFMVLVEVVNYNWLPDRARFEPMFRLPEGWNCLRKLMAAGNEDEKMRPRFKLKSNPNKQLTYEASLELFDEVKVDSGLDSGLDLDPLHMDEWHTQRKPLSTQMGAFLTGGDLDGLLPAHWQDEHSEATKQPAPRFDMDFHQSVSRLVGGRSMARQLVMDRRARISYDMNLITGTCKIGPEPTPTWEMSFLRDKDNSSTEVIRMAENLRRLQSYDLFTKLFLADEDDSGNRLFHLLNKYAEEVSLEDGVLVNIIHETYEYEYPTLMLNPALSGPARIVREFTMSESNGRLSGDPQSMPYVTVRVYLLQEDRSKVRALLSMRMQQVREAGLSDFLSLAQFAECFNEGQPLSDRRLASMTIEYPMLSHMDRLMAHMSTNAIRDQFYALLLAQNRLWPSQLDGRARFEFTGHDNLLRVHFNVLEAPTSSVYFQKLFMCTISDKLISLVETRILPNQLACSRWCDQINCVAMSFCDDSQCNVLPARAFINYATSNEANRRSRPAERGDGASRYPEEWHALLSNCSFTGTCTYFYNRQMIKPRPLDSFRDFLDRTVNSRSNKLALKELSLPLGNSQRFLEPTRFYESSDMFRWQHEDFSDPFEEVLSSSVDSLEPLPNDTSPSSSPLASGGDSIELADSFAVWHSHARLPLDAGKIDQLNNDLALGHSSKFLIIWATATSRAGCLQECQRNRCLLVSSCSGPQRCTMIVATGTESVLKLGALHELVEADYAQGCAISIRDHLELFHLFENTQKPQRHSRQLDGYTREECAVACETLGSDCLAFDLCTTRAGSGDSSRVCFLQDTHVSQDAFDRSVLLPAWDRDTTSTEASHGGSLNGSGRPTCDHYSKSLLAGFYQRIPNMKFKELHQSELEGVSVDKCAADCLQDDTCRGFEHCQNPKRAPTQSCYPIRSSGGGREGAPAASLKDQLILSRACSIYLPKASLTRMRTEQALGITPRAADEPSGNWLTHMIGYLLITATVGAIVQLAYVKLGGRRPIQLHGDRL